MGFTGLARWVNAPTSGLQLIRENIVSNHNGMMTGKWNLSIKSYRSTLGQIPGLQLPSERTLCALTMNENVFVLLEDPMAPNHSDVVTASTGGETGTPFVHSLGHFRTTYLTLSPPGAFDQLLTQLKARWVPVRQTSSSIQRSHPTTGHQVLIDGLIFAIPPDWVVRVGNVVLAGGAVKGMLLEAEYLPLPTLRSPLADGTSELLSNLLTSLLPNLPDAKTVAVTITDNQWEDILWDNQDTPSNSAENMEGEDDIYTYGDESTVLKQKRDWTGVERDRRSAFLIIGALRSEGIL